MAELPPALPSTRAAEAPPGLWALRISGQGELQPARHGRCSQLPRYAGTHSKTGPPCKKNKNLESTPSLSCCVRPQDAMRVIGFSPAEVTELLQVTAVVLKLGNIQLSSSFQASGMEACGITEPQGRDGGRDGNRGSGHPLSPSSALALPFPHTELREICELIGLDPSTLEKALCTRTVKARDETVLTTLTVPQVSRTSPSRGDDAWQPPMSRHQPLSPLPRATTAGTRWPRTSTAASSTGW